MKERELFKKVSQLVESGDFEKALKIIDNHIEKESKNPELYLEKGKLLKHLQRFTEAINCFQKVLSLKPNYHEALNLRNMAQDILRFQQIDIYASTNLTNDPWLDD